MSFRINTNIAALQAYESLDKVNRETVKAQIKIATGKKINSVGDDTSGFNTGKSLEGKINVSKSALNNVTSAKDLLATAEGSLLQINDLLIKIEGKLSDAVNPTSNKENVSNDIKALAKEIKATLQTTKFNNTVLLSGNSNAALDVNKGVSTFKFQVGGDGNDDASTLEIDYATSTAKMSSQLTTDMSLPITSTDTWKLNSEELWKALDRFGASDTVATDAAKTSKMLSLSVTGNAIDSAGVAVTSSTIELSSLRANLFSLKATVSTALSSIGNFSQRLDIREQTLNIGISNSQSSFSRLFDADVAMEQLNATRGSILGQAATAMLTQLNQAPQQVLQLFK